MRRILVMKEMERYNLYMPSKTFADVLKNRKPAVITMHDVIMTQQKLRENPDMQVPLEMRQTIASYEASAAKRREQFSRAFPGLLGEASETSSRQLDGSARPISNGPASLAIRKVQEQMSGNANPKAMRLGGCPRTVGEVADQAEAPAWQNSKLITDLLAPVPKVMHVYHTHVHEMRQDDVGIGLQPEDHSTLLENLPKGADRLDAAIGLDGNSLYIRCPSGWLEESLGEIMPKIIRHMQKKTSDPQFQGLGSTELANMFSQASSLKTRRSTIGNCFTQMKKICEGRCKQVLIKSGQKWQLNTELDCYKDLRKRKG